MRGTNNINNKDRADFRVKDIKNERFMQDKVILKALKTIESYKMIKRGDRVLISISGGPDSTFLTHLLYLLRPHLNLTLFGFSLDHMTRSGESTADARFVRELCREMDIKLFEQKIDVAKWCMSNKLSFQEGARKIRIEKLIEISEKKRIDRIATGHNAGDSIETFFINLMRGAGAGGLSGIKPVAGKFIRPLIEIRGEDIVSYMNEKKISYCMDRTNVENIYFRNRIRNILIPFISRHFGESFKINILRLAGILRDEDDFLRQYTAAIVKDIVTVECRGNDGKPAFIKMPILKITDKKVAIQRRIIMQILEMMAGNLKDITFKNIDDILRMCFPGGESKIICPEEKIRVFKIGNYIYFAGIGHMEILPDEFVRFLKYYEPVRTVDKTERKEKEVKIGERLRLEDFNIELYSEILKNDSSRINLNEVPAMEAFMDYDRIKPPVKVRSRKKGDKFYPLGMDAIKKLKDFFIDNKIPVHLRGLVPVFTDEEKIIWVGGCRIDNRVKVTGNTREVLHLKLFKK
jgi:tRNA(Ile)-lysidine synthase